MLSWLTNPMVNEWYENRDGTTLDEIIASYRACVIGIDHEHPAIIEWQNKPIGYLQFYETQKETGYHVKEPILAEPNVWAMDIFLGEPDFYGKGIGSASLTLMLDYLFTQMGAATVIIDPDVRNVRAIRAYEKAGFRKTKLLKNWDTYGDKWTDSWLMICEKRADASS